MSIRVFDSHTHSDNSMDAHHSVTFMCENAVEKELAGLCITDHCEMRRYREDRYEKRINQSAFDVSRAQRVFGAKLTVLLGIEISDVFYNLELTDQALGSQPFDMVLASQHMDPDNGEDIYYTNFKTWSDEKIDEYLQRYFFTLLQIARWNKFDVMAHLTYPIRYISGVHKIPVDLTKYDDWIDQIFQELARNGKAIEINTSGLWQPLGDTMPPLRWLKRYRELGGEFVTVGSDAHSADTLGRGILSGRQMLAEAGFDKFTVFKQRQPLLMALK